MCPVVDFAAAIFACIPFPSFGSVGEARMRQVGENHLHLRTYVLFAELLFRNSVFPHTSGERGSAA